MMFNCLLKYQVALCASRVSYPNKKMSKYIGYEEPEVDDS